MGILPVEEHQTALGLDQILNVQVAVAQHGAGRRQRGERRETIVPPPRAAASARERVAAAARAALR